MLGNGNLQIFMVISVLISQTFSSVLWHLEKTEEVKNTRDNRKKENVHRGVLLSYSTSAKNMLCQDLYHAQLYDEYNYFAPEATSSSTLNISEPNQFRGQDNEESVDSSIDSRVTDDPTNSGNPTHALVVKKVSIADKASDEEDIFFQCAIRNIHSRIPKEKMYLLSFAFLSHWLYTSTPDNEHVEHAKLRHNMGVSPDFVDLEEEVLERKYINMRETIETLRSESAAYIELVEKKDDISALTQWKKFILCASVLSSPIYRDMFRSTRLEVSKNWMVRSKSTLQYGRRNVFFSSKDFKEKLMNDDCMRCRGFEHFSYYDHQLWTNLCITRSFEDKNSVYVFQSGDDDMLFMSKYFKNISVLINAQEKIADKNIAFDL